MNKQEKLLREIAIILMGLGWLICIGIIILGLFATPLKAGSIIIVGTVLAFAAGHYMDAFQKRWSEEKEEVAKKIVLYSPAGMPSLPVCDTCLERGIETHGTNYETTETDIRLVLGGYFGRHGASGHSTGDR